MTEYSFICDKEDGGCGNVFIVTMNRNTYTSHQACPKCQQTQAVHRHFQNDTPTICMDPQTLGMRAEKNKMSREAQQHITEKHRQ